MWNEAVLQTGLFDGGKQHKTRWKVDKNQQKEARQNYNVKGSAVKSKK